MDESAAIISPDPVPVQAGYINEYPARSCSGRISKIWIWYCPSEYAEVIRQQVIKLVLKTLMQMRAQKEHRI